MTYRDIIETLEASCGWAASIAAGDVRVLDDERGALYPCFGWQPVSISVSASGDTVTARLTVFYIEREIRGGGNVVPVQSVGVNALYDTVAAVCEALAIPVPALTFVPFREHLADMCCGVYTEVSFEALRDTLCPVDYSGDTATGAGALGAVRRYVKNDY